MSQTIPIPQARQMMNEGLVITVEPIISSGSGRVFTDKDGWTVRTGDHALSAHFEHTLVITSGGAHSADCRLGHPEGVVRSVG